MTNQEKWGFYAPKSNVSLLRLLTQTGLSRGKITRHIHRLWKRFHGDIVDIQIRSVKYRLNISNNMTDIKILSSSKEYDKEELDVLRQQCRGGVFVDLGANIGYYSLALATGGADSVLSIEPNPPTLKRLRFNIAINGLDDRIQVAPVGVGDHGEAQLFSTGDLGCASLLEKDAPNCSPTTIQTRPLLSILDEHNIQTIDGMKVDVEGLEDRALIPFFETAPKNRWPSCLVIEHAHRPDWKTDLIAYLLDQGYVQTNRTRANTVLTKTE